MTYPEAIQHLLDLRGNPVAGLAVTIVPAGDRLRGQDAMPASFERTTNDHGWIEFPFPAPTWTRTPS